MSETARISNSPDSQMPAEEDGFTFPPFPEPSDVDFDEDISEDERKFYKSRFHDLHLITSQRMHCTSCDRHLGCSASKDGRMRMHPMLRTLVCNTCFAFYNSGEFEKGDDGSELYCRWCGQGGQVYCCSDCPHVFCAKCIKRNLGTSKIKEIENTDDWKCFKCSNRCLWDLRASCWALLRYCDLKNRITLATQDQALKDKYLADCAKDYSDCCKSKKRREKVENKKKDEKKEADASVKKATAAVISKIPPTIQVKKFASINLDDSKPDNSKKGAKRSLSPKQKSVFLKNPIAVTANKTYPAFPSMPKKIRLSSPNLGNPMRFVADRKGMNTPPTPIRIRAKAPQPPMPIPVMTPFNGYNSAPSYNSFINDNINLSLESLTQGLDMAAVASINNNSQQDDVVCTPDFPMEPLCEVTEDNGDDDVQCITPINVHKMSQPPPLIPRTANTLPDLSPDNIIQMTENDVTVNAQTGGLKFRVDPQTLSSNKMYRLPDGRIFAINANPNMPGGYSATIVAVTEAATKNTPKGATYAAKLSAIPTQTPSPIPKPVRTPVSRSSSAKRVSNAKTNTNTRVTRGTETVSRECDLEVPVEWYRYNLIDAVDALEYSLSRLNKLKKDATTAHLRSRTVNEIRGLHKSLERLLHTSTSRFNEIRDNLNKGFKQYLAKKAGNNLPSNNISDDDDDDDVEILPNPEEEDPIFIDENSVDSNANDTNSIDQQEVDLTGAMSNSELNDSGDKSIEMLDENFLKENENLEPSQSIEKSAQIDTQSEDIDPLGNTATEKSDDQNKSSEKEDTSSKLSPEGDSGNAQIDESPKNNNEDKNGKTDEVPTKPDSEPESNNETVESDQHKEKENSENGTISSNTEYAETTEKKNMNGAEDPKKVDSELREKDDTSSEKKPEDKNLEKVDNGVEVNDNQDINDKVQDAEMSEEMIETLLKGDDGENDDDSQTITNTEIIGI